jgi:hypothetical protein
VRNCRKFENSAYAPGGDRFHVARQNSRNERVVQWTTGCTGSRFALLHHTDAVREYAYDASPLGKLEVALTEAKTKGWTVVD